MWRPRKHLKHMQKQIYDSKQNKNHQKIKTLLQNSDQNQILSYKFDHVLSNPREKSHNVHQEWGTKTDLESQINQAKQTQKS